MLANPLPQDFQKKAIAKIYLVPNVSKQCCQMV
jgi:hypothetical protein